MEPLPIAHIGILVADLETSRERWEKAMGVPFSPIVRYRSAAWSDLVESTLHPNDLRQAIYLGVSPSIEIQEFVSSASHSSSLGEGGHHLGFPPVADNNARREELAALGISMSGGAQHAGRWIIQFTDSRSLNDVSTEWVEESPGHLDLKDDGSPFDRLPDGSPTPFDISTMLEPRGGRPPSGIVELGVLVHDLDAAMAAWPAVTGYDFEQSADGERSARSHTVHPSVRLVETPGASTPQGLTYAIVTTQDAAATRARLEHEAVPLVEGTVAPTDGVDVDPDFLNGFSIRFRRVGP